MYCFELVGISYFLQMSVLAMHALVAGLYSRPTHPRPRAGHRQAIGDKLFASVIWTTWGFFLIVRLLLPCAVSGTAVAPVRLANYMLMASPLLVAAVLLRHRMGSLLVQYSLFSGALFLIIVVATGGRWPWTRDDWRFWALLGALLVADAGGYRLLLAVSGSLSVRNRQDDMPRPSCESPQGRPSRSDREDDELIANPPNQA